MNMKKAIRGSLSLVFATVIWGSAFIAQSVGMDFIGPFTFQAVRCLLAVLILLPLTVLTDLAKKDGKTYLSRWTDKALWKAGILCGIPLFLAVNFQQVGLLYTGTGKAGFLTAMYIVIVPVIGFFLREKTSFFVPISVAIAVVGLYLLCSVGDSSVGLGDLLLLMCALMFSVQITVVDAVAADQDPLRLNAVQFLVCAILSSVIMAVRESPTWDLILACKVPLLYAGFLSSGIAYSLQIFGQRDLEATAASLLMSLESVFAALFGWLLLKQVMSPTEILGSILIFIAVILSQIPTKSKARTAE